MGVGFVVCLFPCGVLRIVLFVPALAWAGPFVLPSALLPSVSTPPLAAQVVRCIAFLFVAGMVDVAAVVVMVVVGLVAPASLNLDL